MVIAEVSDYSRHGDTVGLVMQDFGTKYIDFFPAATKSAADTQQALLQFAGPRDKVKRIYSDGSGELVSAIKEVGWRHDLATPNRPQSNGIAERAVRRVLEGTQGLS